MRLFVNIGKKYIFLGYLVITRSLNNTYRKVYYDVNLYDRPSKLNKCNTVKLSSRHCMHCKLQIHLTVHLKLDLFIILLIRLYHKWTNSNARLAKKIFRSKCYKNFLKTAVVQSLLYMYKWHQ